jgi:hypothetical protein
MENNLDIFVFTHKTPKIVPNNEAFKLVCLEDDAKNVVTDKEKIICYKHNENIFDLEHAYSEGTRMHYIWKNVPLKKYVGTAHYRRYFKFMENIPNLDDLFETYDAILPSFYLGWPSIKSQYNNSHNVEDLENMMEIIKIHYPEYYDIAIKTMDNNDFKPCNIFIMKSEMFNEYCKFIFGVFDKFNEKYGFKKDLDVFNWVINRLDLYTKDKHGMLYSANYQARIHAFLMERLSNVFYNKNIKNPYLVELVLTEQNFDIETQFFNLYEK